jgi:hypothetical protein
VIRIAFDDEALVEQTDALAEAISAKSGNNFARYCRRELDSDFLESIGQVVLRGDRRRWCDSSNTSSYESKWRRIVNQAAEPKRQYETSQRISMQSP